MYNTFLQLICFFLVNLFFSIYFILEGIVLGVGLCQFICKRNEKLQEVQELQGQSIFIKIVAPFFYGNIIWFLAGTVVMFSAFPAAFASVFSGLNHLISFIVIAYLFRMVLQEFQQHKFCKRQLNYLTSFASAVIILAIGLCLGNLIRGIPMDKQGNSLAGITFLFNPYSLIVAITLLLIITVYGGLYLLQKVPLPRFANDSASLYHQILNLMNQLRLPTFIFLVLTSVITLFNYHREHFLSSLIIFNVAALIICGLSFFFLGRGKTTISFTIWGFMLLVCWGLFLTVIFPFFSSPISDKYAPTIFNSASSTLSLNWVIGIILLSFPVIILFTLWVYNVFKGRVKH